LVISNWPNLASNKKVLIPLFVAKWLKRLNFLKNKTADSMIVQGVEIPPALQNCRHVWLYLVNGKWIISTRSQEIAHFSNEADALTWWKEFEMLRGFTVKNPKRGEPQRKTAAVLQAKSHSTVSLHSKTARQITPERRQAVLAKINQGRYDNERDLLTLMKNAADRGENKILNAVHQRLKIVAPETYRKLVGPLHIRDPQGRKKCYCANPASLIKIKNDIISDNIKEESLLCDDCWKEDISSAWGHYGPRGKKIIDTEIWTTLCKRRGDTKYAIC
jgi:hypothetical protein